MRLGLVLFAREIMRNACLTGVYKVSLQTALGLQTTSKTENCKQTSAFMTSILRLYLSLLSDKACRIPLPSQRDEPQRIIRPRPRLGLKIMVIRHRR